MFNDPIIYDKRRGFTLVELVVVIAIIAVLMSLAIITINTVRRQSRNAQLREDARTIKAALESYYASEKKYPEYSGTTNGRINAYTLLDSDGGLDGIDKSPQGIGELLSYVGSASVNPSESGRVCYTSSNPNKGYWLWVLTEDSVNAGIGCHINDKKPDGTSVNKAGYGNVKDGDHVNCPSGMDGCEL